MSFVKFITVAVAGLFLFTMAMAFHSSQLYLMSSALVSIPFISYAMTKIAVRHLECRRRSDEHVFEGDLVQVHIRLEGNSPFLGSIEIDDLLPEWMEKVDVQRGEEEPSPGDTMLSYTARALKRGEYTLGPLRLHMTDPLGFFTFTGTCWETSKLVVLPKALEIPGLRTCLTGSFGEHPFDGAGTKGAGTEFHGVREYRTGDELRRVHWPSTARLGKLNVVEFEHARAGEAVIAIDVQRDSEVGGGRFTSLEYAVKIAADIVQQALAHGSTVRLAHAGAEGPVSTDGSGRDHLYLVLDALARVEADRPEPLSAVLASVVESVTPNSVVICLTSHVCDELPQSVEMLASRGAKIKFILMTFAETPAEETYLSLARLAAAGASLIVVRCSMTAMEGWIAYEHHE